MPNTVANQVLLFESGLEKFADPYPIEISSMATIAEVPASRWRSRDLVIHLYAALIMRYHSLNAERGALEAQITKAKWKLNSGRHLSITRFDYR